MAGRVFIDTGFIVALISKGDEYHERAVVLADEYEGYPVLITDAVLLEIGNALARRYRKQAAEVIRHFLSSSEVEVVRLNSSLLERALGIYESHQDKEWGLVDCISFIAMAEAGITDALTFDKHFEQAGFQVV